MKQGKDRIIFPLDVATIGEAKKYVELLADSVGLFKVGLELFIRSGPEIIEVIHSTSTARIFLDLKLHDIPATVGRAVARIAELDVAFATVHVGETRRKGGDSGCYRTYQCIDAGFEIRRLSPGSG